MKMINEALEELAESVESFDGEMAEYLRGTKGYSPQQIADDLSLWGASGSVMDQVAAQERDVQRLFEAKAIALGTVLRNSGVIKSRMDKWIYAFEIWEKYGE